MNILPLSSTIIFFLTPDKFFSRNYKRTNLTRKLIQEKATPSIELYNKYNVKNGNKYEISGNTSRISGNISAILDFSSDKRYNSAEWRYSAICQGLSTFPAGKLQLF